MIVVHPLGLNLVPFVVLENANINFN